MPKTPSSLLQNYWHDMLLKGLTFIFSIERERERDPCQCSLSFFGGRWGNKKGILLDFELLTHIDVYLCMIL
jgi:hypothetical protein